jgi:hypothetical protein
MAGAGIQPVAAVRMEGMYSIPVEHGIEAASQSYKKGSLLLYSSGSLAICATNPALCVGISLSAATGVTGADVPFVPILPSLLFEMSVDGTLSTNAPATGKPSDFTIGTAYGLSLDAATGLFYLASNLTTTNARVRLIEYDADQASIIQGRVRVRWLLTATYLYQQP